MGMESMPEASDISSLPLGTADRARQILSDFILGLAKRSDLLFAGILGLQYPLVVVIALLVTPGAWAGLAGIAANPLMLALAVGTPVALLPVLMVMSEPGRVANRYVIAVSQVLMSGLLVVLTANKGLSFLHVYASLAILTFYRNSLLLLVASLTVIAEFAVLYSFWPSLLGADSHGLGWQAYLGWLLFQNALCMVGINQVMSEWRIASLSLAEHEANQIRALGEIGTKEGELRESLSKLRAQELRTSLILQRTHEAFIAIDQEGCITDWNSQAEKTFGWTELEAIGSLLTDTIIPPSYREAHKQGLARYLKTGQGQIINRTIEVPALHKDGREFPVELSVTPIEIGETLSFCAFLRDITERKRLIGELGLARDKAQESSRLKSQFVANISHEIRTPMNGIIGMSNILLKTSLSSVQRDYVNTIRDAGKSLLRVINDILDLSKIEAERIELESIDFDLTQLTESVGELLSAQAQNNGLALLTFVAPQLPEILNGDPERIKQILINLTGNAIKFSSEGKVVISATLEAEEEDCIWVRFAVSDTGVGISEEEARSLFQPFVQADGTISRKYGGTGLGLSICKRLVEMMGGEIALDSVKGKGSTFWFTVPLKRASQLSGLRKSYDRLKNVRVLIVDDEPNEREMLANYMSCWDLRSEQVDSLSLSVEQLKRGAAADDPYQVAIVHLSSVGKPGLQSALELSQVVAGDKQISATKLILIHDVDDVDAPRLALSKGFSAALSRPIRQSQLLDTLAQLMAAPASLEPKPARITTERPAAPTPAEGRRPELILIVDDHPVNQRVAALYLAELGFTTHCVGSGQEAVDEIKRQDYDLIFMDCQMPDMDGLEATRQIRLLEAETGKHVPIVAMTAHAMKGDRESCLDAGMDDYMSKPLDQEDLGLVVNAFLPLQSGPEPRNAGRETVRAIELDVCAPLTRDSAQATIARMRKLFGAADTSSLLKIFVDDGTTTLGKLEGCIGTANRDEVAALTHYLKGACGLLQANHVQMICEQMESAALEEDWEKVRQTHRALVESFDELRAYVDCPPPDEEVTQS